VNEDTGERHVTFGSSAKTSDFIVDSLQAWWEHLEPTRRDGITRLQIKADNGPESNGQRTQFLKRMVDFADDIGKPIQLLYYPPYHSKYNPAGVGSEHDMEGTPPDHLNESPDLRKRHFTVESGHARGRGTTETQPRTSQVGYPDRTGLLGIRFSLI
jgi:hypothetical protein